MAGLVNKETNRNVSDFINSIEHPTRKEDCIKLLSIIEEITGEKPKIWGNKKVPDFLIGFGKYKYQRKGSKEQLEWFNVGFAPRKTKLTVYLAFDINEQEDLIKNLGKANWGKGCLHIIKLKDIDIDILKQLLERSKNSRWH